MKERTTSPAASSRVCRVVAIENGEREWLTVLAQQLSHMVGVNGVAIGAKSRLKVDYDAALVGYGEIEATVDEAGLVRRKTLAWRLRGVWYRYLDQNIRANARSRGGGACCSRPPPGAGGGGNGG